MLGIGLGVTGTLHRLRNVVYDAVLPVGDGDQCLVELARRIPRVHDLLHRSPALGRSLLEEPDRIPIAMVQVAQIRFLVRGDQRNRRRSWRQFAADGLADDDRDVFGLFPGQGGGEAVHGDAAALGGQQRRGSRLSFATADR